MSQSEKVPSDEVIGCSRLADEIEVHMDDCEPCQSVRDFEGRKGYTACSKVLMYSHDPDNENLHNYAYQFASAASHFAVVNTAAFDTKTKSDRCTWLVEHLTKLWQAWIRTATGSWGVPDEVEVQVFMPSEAENATWVYPNGDPVCMVTGKLEWGETLPSGSTLDHWDLPLITDMASWAKTLKNSSPSTIISGITRG